MKTEQRVKKPSILFVASQTFNNSDGGLESATRIAEELGNRIEWILVTNRSSPFTWRWKRAGAKVYVTAQIRSNSKIGRGINLIILSCDIWLRAYRHKPEIIHVNDTKAYKASEFASNWFKIPLILSIRDTKPTGERYDAPHWRRLATKAERIVVLSQSMADNLADNIQVERTKMCVIGSIVEKSWSEEVQKETRNSNRKGLGIQENEFAIGIIGAVRSKKNQLTLIQKIKHHSSIILPHFKFHFLGDFDPQKDEYAKQCYDLSKDSLLKERVMFHGHQESMRIWYECLDAVVIASLNEGLARAMIESMACGTPVVSFDVSSAHENLSDTGAGKVVEQGNYVALFQAIAELASDEEFYRLCSQAGRKWVCTRYTASLVGQSYNELYSALIKERSNNHRDSM